MINEIWILVGWVIRASILGFVISAVFAGWMKLSRNRFLIPYVSIVSIFLCSFFVLNDIDAANLLTDNWTWGILAGVLVSIFLVKTVRTQPVSRQSTGAVLGLDIAWAGLVYGIIDALFLNVMPLVSVWIGASQFDWAGTLAGKIGIGAAGLFSSLLVTLTYHLGYPEFRNRSVGLVLVGNLIITIAFLLSGNPFGSLISHTAMHIEPCCKGQRRRSNFHLITIRPPHGNFQWSRF